MSRQPTTSAQALRWHNQALSDMAMHLDIQVDYDDPQVGWFVTRMTRGGPMVPARIWLEQEVCPDTGELLSDEVLKCEINGQPRDAYEVWHWICGEPIEESAFNYLIARGEFAREWAPSEPAANPYSRVDWSKVPTPTFNEEAQP